jgi:diaminohydroxyphosphoribosylaminopyrimidine deaminase/5-amino-6-(5-phosphoribosylamino)uracil reductase
MMMSGVDDKTWMARAIELARHGWHTTQPNPRVGCVIVKNNQLLAEGFHKKAGEPHAEIIALQQLKNIADANGATVYVTLEPCCHTGKTPPCTNALITAKVQRIVYGMQDPNPLVAGKGLQQLRDAGIAVVGPVLEAECRALNRGFITRMQTGLPFVRCKLAMSLDGRTAMASGESQWITGDDAREDVQLLRAQSCAIITGINTILQDDPALTVRSGKLPVEAKEKQPLRVILDRNHRLPKNARILKQPGETLVLHDTADLRTVLKQLGDRPCNEVLIESGAILASAFIEQGLVDELILYMAPTLLGSSARPLLVLPLDNMSQQLALNITEIKPIGKDWRITVEFAPRAH